MSLKPDSLNLQAQIKKSHPAALNGRAGLDFSYNETLTCLRQFNRRFAETPFSFSRENDILTYCRLNKVIE